MSECSLPQLESSSCEVASIILDSGKEDMKDSVLKTASHMLDKAVEPTQVVSVLEETRRGIAQQQKEWMDFLKKQVMDKSVFFE